MARFTTCGDPNCAGCKGEKRELTAEEVLVGGPIQAFLTGLWRTYEQQGGSGSGFSIVGLPSVDDIVTVDIGTANIFQLGPVNAGTDTPNAKTIPHEERDLREEVEKSFLKTEHKIGWSQIIGNDAAREALIEAIEHPVKQKDLYAFYGMKPAKGVLLYGHQAAARPCSARRRPARSPPSTARCPDGTRTL